MPTRPSQRLALPTSPTAPLDYLWQQPICIYGRKGIGKTTAASVAIDSLLPEGQHVINFRFERARQNLPILQFPSRKDKVKRLTWPLFIDCLEQFVEDDMYQVACIDSLDKCYDECFEYVCGLHDCTHPSEKKRDAPAVWDAIKIEFESTLMTVLDYQKSFIFLSHEKTRIEELADGGEYERFDLSCKPAAAKIVKDICEFVIHYGYTDTRTGEGDRSAARVFTVRNKDNSVECACGRDDVFCQPDGKPLFRIPVPSVRAEGLTIGQTVGQVLQQAYDNELWDYDYDPREEERKAKRAARKKKKVVRTSK